MKKILLLLIILIGCTNQITNFDECIAAGNPVMESFPRQCRVGDIGFTEQLLHHLDLDDAIHIAKNSECMNYGKLKETSFYNENSKTWWIDMDVEKEGCNPACVISATDLHAEINWRCTGLQ